MSITGWSGIYHHLYLPPQPGIPATPVLAPANVPTPDTFPHRRPIFLKYTCRRMKKIEAQIMECMQSSFSDCVVRKLLPCNANFVDFAQDPDTPSMKCTPSSMYVPCMDPYDNITGRGRHPAIDNHWKILLPQAIQHEVFPDALPADANAPDIEFESYEFIYSGQVHLLFIVLDHAGPTEHPVVGTTYLVSHNKEASNALANEAIAWRHQFHRSILVYEHGQLTSNAEEAKRLSNVPWDSVVLDPGKKMSLQEDCSIFFDQVCVYKDLGLKWRNGLVYHGPTGNGKTTTIKAIMRMLHLRTKPIKSLYIRSLNTSYGPEGAIKDIFAMAKKHSPCCLVFEDIDVHLSNTVYELFFDKLDDVEAMCGVFLIVTTTDIEKLDHGFTKYSSRFNKTYKFGNPMEHERVHFIRVWQHKIRQKQPKIPFPTSCIQSLAILTKGLSFAQMDVVFKQSLLELGWMVGTVAWRNRMPRGSRNYVEPKTEQWILERNWFGGIEPVDWHQKSVWQNFTMCRDIFKQVGALRKGILKVSPKHKQK